MIHKTQSPEETQRIFQELRVRQNELELQNAQLRLEQAKSDVARAHYLALYDLAPVGYCILNTQGLILQANLAALILLGVTRAALGNQPITQFIVKADQDWYWLHCKQIIATGNAQSCELHMLKNDGTPFWVQLHTSVAQDSDGVSELRTAMTDITSNIIQRKKDKTELASLREAAEIANQATSRFLATRSHDLRQPLSALSIYANILKIHVAPAGQPLLANMKDCVASLSELLAKANVGDS